jgi:hypothetical protein
MRIIKPPHRTEAALRPTVYLALDGSWPDGEERIVNEMCSLTRGTLFLPDTKDTDYRWRYNAAWNSNVIAFWFPKGDADQSTKLIELGIQIGRYAVGFGGNKIIIGAHEKSSSLTAILRMVEAANQTLNGTWRFNVITQFQVFLQKIRESV